MYDIISCLFSNLYVAVCSVGLNALLQELQLTECIKIACGVKKTCSRPRHVCVCRIFVQCLFARQVVKCYSVIYPLK